MPANFDTSFIPQQPLLRVEGAPSRREPVNLALVLALIVFFVTGIVAGGMFFWKKQVVAQIIAKEQQLADAEKTISIDEINSYKRLQMQLDSAKQLIDDHTIFSVVLDMIEARAAQNVGLTALGYKIEGGNVFVTLQGQAPSYAAVYFQQETWREMASFVKGVEVAGLSLDEKTAIVSFGANILIDSSRLEFARVLEEKRSREARVQSAAAAGIPEISASANTLQGTTSNSPLVP